MSAALLVRVFFTLHGSFYPSKSSTPSVRVDSSILERCKLCGHKTQNYTADILLLCWGSGAYAQSLKMANVILLVACAQWWLLLCKGLFEPRLQTGLTFTQLLFRERVVVAVLFFGRGSERRLLVLGLLQKRKERPPVPNTAVRVNSRGSRSSNTTAVLLYVQLTAVRVFSSAYCVTMY